MHLSFDLLLPLLYYLFLIAKNQKYKMAAAQIDYFIID